MPMWRSEWQFVATGVRAEWQVDKTGVRAAWKGRQLVPATRVYRRYAKSMRKEACQMLLTMCSGRIG